jgi:deoxyxylulose-5-phosphate synthase
MTVYAPATAEEVGSMLRDAVYFCTGPAAIRYPRGYCCTEDEITYETDPHAKVTLISYGTTMANACAAAKLLRQRGIGVEVVRLKTLKPIDYAAIARSVMQTGFGVVIEDTVSSGCVGSDIAATLTEKGIVCKWLLLNLGDSFVPHGKVEQLHELTQLDPASIAKKTREVLKI